jgi:nucleotide-binding universal stress UspA family protein
MRLLIAYDGSECADTALDLVRAGLSSAEDALVLSVAEVWLAPDEAFSGATVTEEVLREIRREAKESLQAAHELAARARDRLKTQFPHWHVHALATAGPAASEIIKNAEGLPADLVVMGSHGHSFGGRLALGSVSFKVLTHLARTVRIARKLPARGEVGVAAPRLIAAIDGSENSQAVLDQICSRVWPSGTEIRVITVADERLLPAWILGGTGFEGTDVERHAGSIARNAVQFLEDAGLVASAAPTERGDARSVLLDAAKSWNADCIFVGARGMTRAQRLLLGSVSTAIAMHAPCSVEVVHQHAASS